MVGRKRERCGEGHIELNLLTGYLSVAARRYSWQRMNPAGLNRIEGGEGVAQDFGTEGEIPACRITGFQRHIRWRILSCGHLVCREGRNRKTGPGCIRIGRKDPINLYDDLADVPYCGAAGEQTGEGGAGDRGLSSGRKIVSRLDL